MHSGCQWKKLPIDKVENDKPEVHYTTVYRAFRRWESDGCFDVSVMHGDGTTAAAKKGGDNIGFNGHKKIKGDKLMATAKLAALDIKGSIISLDGVYDCKINLKAIFNRGMNPNMNPNINHNPRGRKKSSVAASQCLIQLYLLNGLI